MKYLIIALLFCFPAYAEVCFSPHEDCESLIIREIDAAESDIDIAAFQFTSKNISKALLRARNRGYDIRIIIDRTSKHTEAVGMLRGRAVVRVARKYKIQHSKYILTGNKVLTRSYNFTYNANKRNSENLILIEDKDVYMEYKENFDKMWKE
jgi:phospholipase D